MLALPRLRKLYFANMKAVVEELSNVKDMSKDQEEFSKGKEELPNPKKDKGEILKEGQQQICGPFLLEHFDSSEYSLAVPGEGTRPEVRIVWMEGEGYSQRDISLMRLALGNLYIGEVRTMKSFLESLLY